MGTPPIMPMLTPMPGMQAAWLGLGLGLGLGFGFGLGLGLGLT